jgi:long-subunit fatty acid transport protein
MMLMGAQEPEKLLFYSLDVMRNYKDTFSFRLGGQVSPVPWLILRAGTYYETGAVPHSHTNIDFASFDRVGLSTGAAFKVKFLTFSLAYSHIIQPDRDVALDESEVYKYFPALPQQVSDQKFQVGAGRYETSYDIFSAAMAMDF